MNDPNIEMLKFATPFYEERLQSSSRLVGGPSEFLERLHKWNANCFTQLQEFSKKDPDILEDYIQSLARTLFGDRSLCVGTTLNQLYESLAPLCDQSRVEVRVGRSFVKVWGTPEMLVFCILKYDVLSMCQGSKVPKGELSSLFCDTILFQESNKSPWQTSTFWYNTFASRVGLINTAPLWVQVEPVYLSNLVTVAFRKNFSRLRMKDPIYTASPDYHNFLFGTLHNKPELVTCETHPDCILFTYDPYDDFRFPKSIPRDGSMFKFNPATKYGSTIEIFWGPSMGCFKAGDYDFQNISLTCEMKRLSEHEAFIDSEAKSVTFVVNGKSVTYPYVNQPEDAYFDFLNTQYTI